MSSFSAKAASFAPFRLLRGCLVFLTIIFIYIEILYLRIISILKLRFIIYTNNSNITFNSNEYSIVHDSKTLKLTKDEFSLLQYLSLNSGINSKEFIQDGIYECPELEDINKISRIVNSIRAKTEKTFNIDFIETFPRRGYKFINKDLKC